jgi:hypothetical protein
MENLSRTLLAAVLLSSLAASPLRAGEIAQRLTGQRVRVTAVSPAFTGTMVGTLVKDGPDTLLLLDPGTGAVSEVPLASVTQIEVSHPRTQAKAWAIAGAGLGVLAGALAGSGYSEVGCGQPGEGYVECEVSAGEAAGVAMAAGAIYGAVGYWLGGKRKVDVWTDASAGRLQISLEPARDGGRASLSFSF